MTTHLKTEKFQKPIFIYLVAVSFILAPLGNIALSLCSFGVNDWYWPTRIFWAYKKLNYLDQCWFCLEIITGILLFNPHKISWLIALFTIGLSIVVNVYNGAFSDSSNIFFWAALPSAPAIAGILYYWRYPYLDRREGWWGIYPRFQVNYVTFISDDNFKMHGRIKNISRTGIYFVLDTPLIREIPIGKIFKIKIGDTELNLKVERLTSGALGLSFCNKCTKELVQTAEKLSSNTDNVSLASLG